MANRKPTATLPTHEVTNQAPPLENYNLLDSDKGLSEALTREGESWLLEPLQKLGFILGCESVIKLGELANRHEPELQQFDRYGHRIDEVNYHPAYHKLMEIATQHQMHNMAWSSPKTGGHVGHATSIYMLFQIEAGVCCPISMTYAAVPSLRCQPDIASQWLPALTKADYDPRSLPPEEKKACTMGMAMTEKQGGSDVRTNSTQAVALGDGGPGSDYELTGHKWFCSAPMSDAFLTLAYSGKALSCFLVPRWRPDGHRNGIHLQRLKDKLGNRSNASAEIEYDKAWGQMIGEEGRGIATIIDMVHHTRLSTAAAPAGLMRQALVQAIHHTKHRLAFQRRLVDQPIMQSVLADLALESEAATALTMRVARSYDESSESEEARGFSRLAVAVAKYWLNKRAPGHVAEALECLGGAGYVEESVLPRLYREAPLNSVWEGSGNIICLDVQRTLQRDPTAFEIYIGELEKASGMNRSLDALIKSLKTDVTSLTERQARYFVERLALGLQGALLLQYAPNFVSEAFCHTRLEGTPPQMGGHGIYGTLPTSVNTEKIIERASI